MRLKVSGLVWAWLCISTVGAAKEYRVFDVVGDSLSVGAASGDASGDTTGWVARLFDGPNDAQRLDRLWPGIAKRNSAVSGSRAANWADLAYPPMRRLLDRHPDLVVVYIGGNDVLVAAGDGVVSEAEWESLRANLRAVVDRLQSNPPFPDIVMVNYFDLFDGHGDHAPASLSLFGLVSQCTERGNDIIRQVAEEKGCRLVDTIDDAFLGHGYGRACGGTDSHALPDYLAMPFPDRFNVHPVAAGHRAIRAEVFKKLQQMKNEETPTEARAWALYE